MTENTEQEKNAVIKKIISVAAFVLAMIFIISIPVFTWFATEQKLASYAPVSAPESLFIGAGHIEIVGGDEQFESVTYLYLSGIDLTKGVDYYDYVFCVYGKAVGGFKLQLAYTTNNQFSYSIYKAREINEETYNGLSTEQQREYISYTTHGDTPATWYYTVNGGALSGSFLNDKTESLKTLGKDATDEAGDQIKYHEKTYNTYTHVDKYAEPLYWQMSESIEGNARRSFAVYFILRVYRNGKNVNDRETDVVCIAAKSATYVAPQEP